MRVRFCIVVVLALAFFTFPAPADEDTTRALSAIKSISREGKGNDDAGPAWKTIVSKGGAALMPTLEAFDDSNPTAANWLRTAVEAIVDGEKAAGRNIPLDKLQQFVVTTNHASSARALAFELLALRDPLAKSRLLPGFTNDKSSDLRRQAIEYVLERVEKRDKTALKPGLEDLYTCTRDKDQIELIAKKLEELGVKVNIAEQFAFVTHFALVGPFDSTGGKGFEKPYPPETAKDTSGTFQGKADAKVAWKMSETADKYGTFDLNNLIEKHKEAVAYALAVIVADKDTPCDIRVGSTNAVQVFLNGKKLAEREEYHHGAPFDATIGKGTLNKGENVIVLKVCQNNQMEAWAQNWQFQLRVCDATGGPLNGITQKLPDSGKQIKLGFIPESAQSKKEEKK